MISLVKGVWTRSGIFRLVLGTDNTVWEWELDLGVVELLDANSSCLACWDNINRDDVKRSRPDTVSRGHVSVACGDCISLCELSVFTVPDNCWVMGW